MIAKQNIFSCKHMNPSAKAGLLVWTVEETAMEAVHFVSHPSYIESTSTQTTRQRKRREIEVRRRTHSRRREFLSKVPRMSLWWWQWMDTREKDSEPRCPLPTEWLQEIVWMPAHVSCVSVTSSSHEKTPCTSHHLRRLLCLLAFESGLLVRSYPSTALSSCVMASCRHLKERKILSLLRLPLPPNCYGRTVRCSRCKRTADIWVCQCGKRESWSWRYIAFPEVVIENIGDDPISPIWFELVWSN